MRIQQLTIQNFRGIKYIQLDFSDSMNVLAGINGAGKSSILDALAILLSWYSARVCREKATGRPINEIDIRNIESNCVLSINATYNGEVISWRQVKTRKGRPKEIQSDFLELNSSTKKLQKEIEESKGNVSVPVLMYYPVNRSVIDIPLRIRTRHSFDDPVATYDDGGSLTSGANFRVFFEWFREMEDLENEKKAEYYDKGEFNNQSSSGILTKQLEAVRKAIETFTGFNDLRIKRHPLRMELKKGPDTLRVEQLSDGEKCLLAMAGDLARRLVIANPGLDDPCLGSGVVLIDEVELHLHPHWQRMIIPKLQEIFPKCQFIVTTHSPQILSHVNKTDIFLLERKGTEGIVYFKPIESYGISSNRILEDLMDVSARPEDIKDRLNHLFGLIDQNSLKKANEEIKQIRSEIGDDPELVRADVLIKRKEFIGK